ncbi:MAG: hypothetical protein ACUVX1_08905 [Chloroflexota bacterium]
MRARLAPEDRERHFRLGWYVLVALILSMVGHGLLGFDLVQTLCYGVLAYILLNALNYRVMFVRQDRDSGRSKGF